MPRKKSASGRSRGVSAVSRVFIQAEKVNKRIKALEKAGLYGIHKTRKLQEFASRTKGIEIKRSKSGKHTIKISSKLNVPQTRLINKKLQEFLDSRLSTPSGIRKARQNMKAKIAKTLEGATGKEMSEADVDKFLDIAKYSEKVRQASILEYIDPSEFMVLVEQARSDNLTADGWVELLNAYVSINNEYMRKEAEELYYKYVR